MNFTALFSGTASVGEYISVGIFAFAIIAILGNTVYGLFRGFGKTSIRLLTVLLAGVSAYILMLVAFRSIDTWFAGKTAEDILAMAVKDYESVISPDILEIVRTIDVPTTERILMIVTVVVIAPIAFIVIFYTLKLLLLIVYKVLVSIFRMSSKDKSTASTVGGALMGLLLGVVVTFIVLLPISSVAGLADDIKPSLTSDDKPEASVEIVEGIYDDYINVPANNFLLKVIRRCGGDILFAEIATVSVGGEEVDMRTEAGAVADVCVDAIPLFKDFRWDDLTEEHKAALSAILEDLGEDDYSAEIVSGALRTVSNAFSANAIPIEIEEPFNSFAKDFVNVFSTSNKENVEGDLRTFLDIYFILSDSGVLTTFLPPEQGGSADSVSVEDLLMADDGNGTVISKVIFKLNLNERTRPLVTSLTKFSLQLIAQSVGNEIANGADITEVYEDVKTGLNDVLADVNNEALSDTEKKEAVKTTINDTLVESGVITEEDVIDEKVLDSIADYAVENFKDLKDEEGNPITELTDEQINNAILSYYEAFAKTGEIPDLGGITGGGAGTEGSGTEGSGTEGSGTEGQFTARQ